MAAPEELQPQWLPLKTAADSLYKGGHFAQAAAAYSSLLNTWQGKMPPQDVNKVMGNRCLASQKAGDWRQALEDAQKTLHYDPAAKAFYRFGAACVTARLPGEAIEALQVAQLLEPTNPETKAKLKKARHSLRASAGKTGPFDDPEQNRALQQSIRRSLEAALQEMQNRRQHVNNPQASEANDTQANGNHDSRERPMECSPPATPVSSPPNEIRRTSSTSGSTMANGIEYEEEPNTSEPLPLTDEEKAEQLKAKGTECYKAADWQGAYEAYRDAIQLAPHRAVYRVNRAAACLMLGKYTEALEDSQTAVRLDPRSVRGYQRAGKALLTMGMLDQAEESYNAALALDPSDAGSREGLRAVATVRNDLEAGAKALEAGDARTALWHADLVLRANLPAVESAQLLRVRAMSALGRHAEALAGSRKLSIEGDPAHPEVLSIRAGTLYSAGNMQLAERVYQEALRMDPDSAACQKGIKRLRSLNSAKEAGNEAFKQGRWQEAHGHYTAALDIDPDLRSSFAAQCFCNRAAAASKLRRHQEALEDAERAIKYDPDFVKAYLRRATAHSALKDFEAAVRDYEKVKNMAPETPRISQLLQEAQRDLKKAKRVDLYKILDVSQDASQEEIKKGYRKMALKLHPDKAQDTDREEAEARFKKLTAAYTLLSDPAKRQKFDAGWSEEEIEQGGTGGGGYSDVDDIYEQLFGQMRGGGSYGYGHSSHGGFPGHSYQSYYH